MRATLLLLPLIFAIASSMSLNINQLNAIMPAGNKANLAKYLPHLNQAMAWGGITTCPRIAAFLGQIAEESGSLHYMEEIASGAAYEGRRDLGNTHPGDGRRFKGRGPIQITGRNNYAAASKGIGHDILNHPTDAALPQYAFKTAVWFWNSRGLNAQADKNNQAGFDQCTLRVNGCLRCSSTHADVRNAFWRKAKSVLGC